MKGQVMARKKIFDDSIYIEKGDIIDRITREQEELEKELSLNLDDLELESIPIFDLNAVIEHYHKKLYSNKKALEYLKDKGLKKHDNYTRFKPGYSDGSLLDLLSKNQKDEFKSLGILAGEAEYFYNCITFPVFDENEKLVSIYGLNVETDAFIKPLYFETCIPIFNKKSLKAYDSVILTDNILEALSLIETGILNAVALNDIVDFTANHLKELKDNRIKEVIFALSTKNDIALDSLQDIFLAEGIAVKSIYPPKPHICWNDALKEGIGKNLIVNLIEDTKAIKPKEDNKVMFNAFNDNGVYVFHINNVCYQITGLKDIFVTNLRVHIKTEYEGNIEHDNLDLYSSRSRNSFSVNVSGKLNLDPVVVEKDLNKILDYLEKDRDKKLSADNDEKKELTQEEIEVGMKFLKSKDMFNEIVDDMTKLGYVGEDLNKQLLYLCASSRKLDDPINILIVSQSASGKSYLVDTVRKLIPNDEVIAVTSLSDQALNYIEDLSHKFLVFGEAVHNEVIEHQIREMLSSKELTRLVTVKDDKQGKMVSKLIKKKVIVSSVMSTTNHKINPENASRYFLINADETKEQTKRIHDAQKLKYTLERQFVKDTIVPEVIKKHHAAQRLLKKHIIVNDFAKHLDFPDSAMRTRRDHDRFIDLIASICYLRQYQKEIKEKDNIEYIECDLTDYEAAYNIMINGVLSSTMSDLPGSAIEVYEAVREYAKVLSETKNLEANEVTFTQREIRENTGFNQMYIKRNLRTLVEYEYIEVVKGGTSRTRGFYKLREDEEINKLNLSMIPKPSEMRM